MYMYSNVLLFQFLVFFLLVIREVPSLILAQTQVSAPLNSRPVVGYRKGGATPIRSPVWSSGFDTLHMGLHMVYVCLF